MKLNRPFFAILIYCWLSSTTLTASQQAVTPPPQPPGVDLEVTWTYSSFGSFIGAAGIITSPTPQGLELYVGGLATDMGPSNDYWHALRWDSVTGEFQTVFASEIFDSALIEIVIGNFHPNTGKELAAVLQDGTVIIYGLQLKNEIFRFTTLAGDVSDVAVADVDGDGLDDVVANTPTMVWAYRGTGDFVLSETQLAAESLVAGQMDADAAIEIASSNGMVMDALSGVIECNIVAGFGSEMALSDIDSDGKLELIHHGTALPVIAVDIDLCATKWTLNVFNLGQILMADVDGTAVEELILSENDGDVLIYDPRNLTLLSTLDNPGRSIFGIGAGDLEGDGDLEVFWGTSTANHLHAMPWTGGPIVWTGHDLIGPFYGPYTGDLDGDGIDEVVSASQFSIDAQDAGKILAFDLDLNLLSISDQAFPFSSNFGIRNVRLQDVDGDSDKEVILAGSIGSEAHIEIYDYQSGGPFTLVWSLPVAIGHQDILDMVVADIDGDGAQEIAIATSASDTGSGGNYIAVYDYLTGVEEWRTASVGSFWDQLRNLQVADVNGDGVLDLVTNILQGAAYIYDGQSQALLATLPGAFISLDLLFATPGQHPHILFGEDSGNLEAYRWDGLSFAQVVTFPLTPTRIKGFTVVNGRYVFTGANSFLRLHDPLSSPNPLWESHRFGPLFGRKIITLPGNRVLSAGENAIVGFELQ